MQGLSVLRDYIEFVEQNIEILLPTTVGLFLLALVLAIWSIAARMAPISRIKTRVASLRQEAVDLSDRAVNLDTELRRRRGTLKGLESQIAKVQSAVDQEHQRQMAGYHRLYEKVTELAGLAEKSLISKSQFTDLLSEFVRIHTESVKIDEALKGLKNLQQRGYIDEMGYEKISSLLLERHYTGELGAKSQLKSIWKRIGDQIT